jgi:hypothetical protein
MVYSRAVEEIMSNWAIKQDTFANDQVVSIAPFAGQSFSLSDLWE